MDTTTRAAELIGLVRDVAPEHTLVKVIREGFPVATIQHIVASGRLNPAEVDRVVLPRKTLANRKKSVRRRRNNPADCCVSRR